METPDYRKQQERDLESVRRVATKIEIMLGEIALREGYDE